MDNTNTTSSLVYALFLAGLAIIVLLASLSGLSVLGLFFSKAPSIHTALLAVIATAALLFFTTHKLIKDIHLYLLGLIFVIIAVAISLLLASVFVDLSWDGNNYHKTAIYALKNGWNPLSGSVSSTTLYSELYPTNEEALWIDHYPHGLWLIQSSIYDAFNNIEMAKATTVFLAFSLLLLTASLLAMSGVGIIRSLGIGLLAAISPANLAQFTTFYCDGFLYSGLAILLLGLIFIIPSSFSTYRKAFLLQISSAFLLCTNTKFTGLAYAGVFALAFLLLYFFLWVKRDSHAKTLQQLVSTGCYFLITVVLSVLVFGCSSYVLNFLHNGNPLYPLAGEEKVDIISYNEPPSFESKSTFEKQVYSYFSEASNLPRDNEGIRSEPVLKIPLSISTTELETLSVPDLRISGFGVLYSGIILISIPLYIGMLITSFKRKRIVFYIVLTYTIVSAALAFGISDSWWARYSPYVYYSNIILLAYYSLCPINTNQIYSHLCHFAKCSLVFLLITNCYLWLTFGVAANYGKSNMTNSQLKEIKEKCESENVLLEVSWRNRPGPIYTFYDNNIECVIYKTDELMSNPDGTFYSVSYRFIKPDGSQA